MATLVTRGLGPGACLPTGGLGGGAATPTVNYVQQAWHLGWAVRAVLEPELVRREWHLGWRVLTEPGLVRREWHLGWRVTTTVQQTWDLSWRVRDTDPVRQTWHLGWRVGQLVRREWHLGWKVARRSHIDPGTGLEVIDDVDPYFSLNGITDIIVVSGDPGGEDPQGDVILHYDGSLVMHDIRVRGYYEQRWQVRIEDDDYATLLSREEAIRSACRAGGTVIFQDVDKYGVPGPAQSWSFIQSPKPSFAIDQEREALWRSSATLVLRIMPS